MDTIISEFTKTFSLPEKSANFILINDFFSERECLLAISMMETSDSVEDLSSRKRLQFDSVELAECWWNRLKPHFEYEKMIDEFGDEWRAIGINSRFRLVCYNPGDKFPTHEDGFYQPSYDVRSFVTSMVYLNSVPEECGGATHFVDIGLKIQPTRGCACTFVVDGLAHCGEELLKGAKYILRTDVMYRCVRAKDFNMRKQLYELSEKDEWSEFFALKKTYLKKREREPRLAHLVPASLRDVPFKPSYLGTQETYLKK